MYIYEYKSFLDWNWTDNWDRKEWWGSVSITIIVRIPIIKKRWSVSRPSCRNNGNPYFGKDILDIPGILINITVTSLWMCWRLKSPVSQSFVQPLVLVQINENIKTLRHCPLWGEFTGDRWIPAQRASNAEMFPFDDVIMKGREWIIQIKRNSASY